MTIDEVFRILKIIVEDCDRLNEPYSKEAVKLGIEALKHYKYHRDNNIISFVKLLPGETK